jgi:hypothetical protein
MSKYHLFGHMDRNLVRKGDRVLKYITPIGTIGTGNGKYFAHLHFSISEGLTPQQLKSYISGWSKDKVQQHYIDPRKVDFTKMFGTKMDVGNFGYDWLQWIGYGYHPGVDVNGLKGGNTDFGMPFKSSCDGIVIFKERTWFRNGGWGNLIIIEESELPKPSVNRIGEWALAIQRHEGYFPGSASYRNNNPGNFRCSSLIMGELGATSCVNNLAVFPTYKKGLDALKQFLIYACTNQLRAYRGDMTLLEFYEVYAPRADKNNPNNYAGAIAQELGVSIYTQIKSLNN